MVTEVYKIQKGNKIFYARLDMELYSNNYVGWQCYKYGEFIYTKWSNLKTLRFDKNEIIETFKRDVVE